MESCPSAWPLELRMMGLFYYQEHFLSFLYDKVTLKAKRLDLPERLEIRHRIAVVQSPFRQHGDISTFGAGGSSVISSRTLGSFRLLTCNSTSMRRHNPSSVGKVTPIDLNFATCCVHKSHLAGSDLKKSIGLETCWEPSLILGR